MSASAAAARDDDDFDPKISRSDCLFSSIKIGDWCRTDMNFDDYFNLNWELKDNNVIDKLPSDPFGMNISASCTMISGWFHHEVDDQHIQYFQNSVEDDDNDDDVINSLFLFDKNKVLHSINQQNATCCNENGNTNGDDDANDGGPPHDGLFYALGYLGLRDLISVESVCKSLRDGVRNDPLLWRNIEIDQPFGESFVDDSLLKITNRASGSLQSLSIVNCLKITDNGLKNVFLQNPGLKKLSVLGCSGLTMEGLLTNLKSLKSTTRGGLKQLRIGGLHSVTMEQYEEITKLLSLNNQNHPNSHKPRFYHGGQLYLSLDDDRQIDIEPCPKCHQLRQVYDCPAKSCNEKHKNYCRACTFCIPRCINCGRCFNERDYLETFCLDFLCLDCFLGFPDGEEEDMRIPLGFHQQTSYHFCLYG